ncbi:hypothetical protein F0562_033250 [Nyssa sinensis]|uniref:protein-serine/threonine phosphatase n=1 Tax=Nyssa sinensis TaxID=561372 RepID=A0A5J5AUU3_9ASTE|nr:hypothetical protein F0562_033250 [Nyssa sinensis]
MRGRNIVSTVSCSLKRKRPPSLQIPNVLRELRADTKTLRDCNPQDDAVCYSGLGVGVTSFKGKKKFMEDTHKIVSCSHGNKDFFGVYDGHGGNTAKEEAVKAGYLKTDEEFLKQGLSSGACCVTAFIEGKEIVISNLGDCRAVLCRGGVAEALTKDHRAGQEDERKRIEDKGGFVEIHRGAWRVHGILSVSRSIGDSHLKDWVMAEPDTKILCLTPDMEYLVLASDGLWEEVGNQEAVDIVMRSCSVEKKLGPTGDMWKENDDEFGCANMSPSKLWRVSLVKQRIRMAQSPSNYKRTVCCWKENKEDFAYENESPSSKARKISLANQMNRMAQSPSYKKTDGSWKENEDDFGGGENESPPSKVRRISLANQMKRMAQSPSYKKTDGSWKENEDEFAHENESPLSKARRISLANQMNIIVRSPNHENCRYKKIPASNGLEAACKELVNLAVARVHLVVSRMMHDPIGIPACFSFNEKLSDDTTAVISRSSQSLLMSIYQTRIASQCRAITITWYKNLLLHGLSVSVQGPDGGNHYFCKVELKPWFFWRKQGAKHFIVDGKPVDVVWDLKAARFNGETEPQSDYYVAIICDEEVVLLVGDLKKDAFRKTGCRPALIDPILVLKKEHIFGKKKFSTRGKFHEKGKFHDISIEYCNSVINDSSFGVFDPEMEIRIDGKLVIHVKHLQWKFRGNESICVNQGRLEVYWDVHDWLFSPGLRHALFIFKPTISPKSPSSALPPSTEAANSLSGEAYNAGGSSGFCLFLYAWKVD